MLNTRGITAPRLIHLFSLELFISKEVAQPSTCLYGVLHPLALSAAGIGRRLSRLVSAGTWAQRWLLVLGASRSSAKIDKGNAAIGFPRVLIAHCD
jgi:hypothetical protein